MKTKLFNKKNKSKKPFYKRDIFLVPSVLFGIVFMVIIIGFFNKTFVLSMFFKQAFQPEINICQEINEDFDFCSFKIAQTAGLDYKINSYFPLIHVKNNNLYSKNNVFSEPSSKLKKKIDNNLKQACSKASLYAKESVDNILDLSHIGKNYFDPISKEGIKYFIFKVKSGGSEEIKNIEIPYVYIKQTKKMRSPIPFVWVVFDKNFDNWVFNFLSSVGVESQDSIKTKPIYGYYCASNHWININSDFKQVREKSEGRSTDVEYFRSLFDNNYNIFNIFNLSMYDYAWLSTDKTIIKQNKIDFSDIIQQIGEGEDNSNENEIKDDNIDDADDLTILQKNSQEMKKDDFLLRKNDKKNGKNDINANPLENLFGNRVKDRLTDNLNNVSKALGDETKNNIKNNIKNGEYLFK